MTKKILVNIWEPLIHGLKEKIDTACMKRDAYLDRVLRYEAEMLDEEIERNSDDARSCIVEHLGLLKKKQVNLLFSEETIDLIADVCDRKNVPRDAFINRVILFLLKGDDNTFMEALYPEINLENIWIKLLEEYEEYSDEKYIIFQMSRLDLIAYIIQNDPFWLMRAKINIAREVDDSIPLLHRKFIKKDFSPSGKIESALGFNCFIEDYDIEGSAAYQKRLEESKRLLDIFNFF